MKRPNFLGSWHSLLLLTTVLSSFAWSGPPTSIEGIPLPDGYQRKICSEGTYSRFIQKLPLKRDTRIRAFNGNDIDMFNVLAVVNLPLLFRQDLEQCADFAMRLWAEYHKETKNLNQFYLFDYNGNRKAFTKSKKTYSEFLKMSFSNSNSYSLKRGSQKVPSEMQLIPGDMLVQNDNGGIGHVSVIVDICEAVGKPRLYLIGFSFMPAQEFHIEAANTQQGLKGWFTLKGFKEYLEENLTFGPPSLRRFGP